MIQEIRNGESSSRQEEALSNERLEGFAASEMADRGPKAVRMDRRDSDEAAVRPVTAIDEDEDFDDDDDDLEDDDLALDDVEIDDVDADTADAAVLADDTELDDDMDDVDLDDDDDEDDDSVL